MNITTTISIPTRSTQRLTLRGFTAADLDALAPIQTSPTTTRCSSASTVCLTASKRSLETRRPDRQESSSRRRPRRQLRQPLLRAGFVTDALDAGASREHVQRHRRWSNIRSIDPYYRKTEVWAATTLAAIGGLMNATGRTGLRSVAALVAGASAGLVAWLVLVPWDLSEIDESGVVIQGGGDDNAGNIAAVAIVLLAVGLVLAFLQGTRTSAAAFTLGGYVTWAVLFGWRVGSARVSGANFFIIPLVIVVIPAAVIVPLVVRSVARRQRRRSVREG